MRGFVSFVVLILLVGAAGNVRPRVELRRHVAGEVRMTCAEGALPHVTARRATPPAPDQRLFVAAIVPVDPAFPPPACALVELAVAPASLFPPTHGRATSARGPPRMRSLIPSTPSV